jgi:hypothetical protein
VGKDLARLLLNPERMLGRLSKISLLTEAGCFLAAYAVTAYVACFAHATYMNALVEHASLLAFSLTVWCIFIVREDLFPTERTGSFVPNVLRVGSVLFKWMLLMVLLAALIRPVELDPTELVAFGAAILLIFTGRCLFHYGEWNTRWRGFETVIVTSYGAVSPLFQTLQAPGGVLCDHNAIRGSPA